MLSSSWWARYVQHKFVCLALHHVIQHSHSQFATAGPTVAGMYCQEWHGLILNAALSGLACDDLSKEAVPLLCWLPSKHSMILPHRTVPSCSQFVCALFPSCVTWPSGRGVSGLLSLKAGHYDLGCFRMNLPALAVLFMTHFHADLEFVISITVVSFYTCQAQLDRNTQGDP